MTQTTMSPATPATPATSATPVKTNNVPPFGGAGMTTAQIMSILHSLDPGAVAVAGAAHTNLGEALGRMVASLTRHAQTLAQNWTGTAAQMAMTRFQELYDQTSALAVQAAQTGSVLTWLGTQVLPKFQQLQTPSTGSELATGGAAGGIAGGVAQAQAQKYLSALSTYLVTANAALPDQIGGVAHLSAAGQADTQTWRRTGAGSTGGPGTGGAAGAGTGGGGAGGPVNGHRAAGSNGLARGANGTGSARGAGGTKTVLGAGVTASALVIGRTGSGAGGTGPVPDSGATGLVPDSSATGPAPDPSTTGAGPGAGGADGTRLPASADAGTPAPVPAVSRLQSAAPVPGSVPGAEPLSPVSAASGTGNLGAGAASPFLPASPVPIVSGLSASGTVGAGRSAGAAVRDGGDPAVRDGGDPAAAGMLPGGHTAAGMLPGVHAAAGDGALPEAPGLDGGLTGGATPLPELPVNTPGVAAVPAGEAPVSSVVAADGPGAPGSGDSPGRDGPGGMPMAGGGSGQPEKERIRHVWAHEDENVWGLPAGCVPPVIEGG